MQYEHIIAFKQLTHRKGSGFISLISFTSVAGIAVGVMALIVVLSVMSGFTRELKTKIIGANPHILVVKSGGIEHTDEIITTVRSLGIDDILTITPYVEGQVIIRSDTNASGTVLKGLTGSDENINGFMSYIQKGSLKALFDNAYISEKEGSERPPGGIALGYQLANILNVSVGDAVHIISSRLERKKRLLPRRAKTLPFEVRAIFDFGMNTLDTSLVLIDINYAQELFNLDKRCSGIAIRVRDVFNVEEIKKVIQAHLGYPYWTQSWIDMNKSFFAALRVEKNVMTILLFLIILVAGFNIVSTLIMVVMEKTKDIGILKALGATKNSIMKIFLLQGIFVGMIGVVLGALLGLLIAFNLNPIADFLEQTTGLEVFPSDVYYINEIPTQINVQDVIIIIGIALVVSILAGLYPARRAASLNPVDALRYE